MESSQTVEPRVGPTDKGSPEKTYKARFISFDGENQYVHLTYKFKVLNDDEINNVDSDEEKDNTESTIEMFDVRKSTAKLDNGAMRRLVNRELVRVSNNDAEFIENHDRIEDDLKDFSIPDHPQEIITGYDIAKSLHFRNKHSRLDDYQRSFLDKRIHSKNADISWVSAAFRVSKGVLYNLRKKRKYSCANNINLLKDNTKFIDKDRLDELIEEIVEESTTPMKISDIRQQLQNQYDIIAPPHKISHILKKNLNYSYK